jgi:hypothetical protein
MILRHSSHIKNYTCNTLDRGLTLTLAAGFSKTPLIVPADAPATKCLISSCKVGNNTARLVLNHSSTGKYKPEEIARCTTV